MERPVKVEFFPKQGKAVVCSFRKESVVTMHGKKWSWERTDGVRQSSSDVQESSNFETKPKWCRGLEFEDHSVTAVRAGAGCQRAKERTRHCNREAERSQSPQGNGATNRRSIRSKESWFCSLEGDDFHFSLPITQ